MSETPVDEWTFAQSRVTDLVTGLDEDAAARHVPACPDWSVRDLLAHMIGLDADVLSGDVADDHNAGWTQRQVDERGQRSVSALLDEWAGLVEDIRSWIGANDASPLGDVIIHEQDLRGALDSPGGRDTAGLAMVRDQIAGMFGEAVADLPVIALRGDSWYWTSGDGDPQTEVRASDFDLFRALTSRRTEAQLRSWTVTGDVGPYLEAFAGLGPLPGELLPE